MIHGSGVVDRCASVRQVDVLSGALLHFARPDQPRSPSYTSPRRRFLETCLATRQPFVIDNTNPLTTERHVYIEAARPAGFRVIGYYFQSIVNDCIRRNAERTSEQIVPLPGLLGTYAKQELPTYGEGFDELYYVKPAGSGFAIEEWRR